MLVDAFRFIFIQVIGHYIVGFTLTVVNDFRRCFSQSSTNFHLILHTQDTIFHSCHGNPESFEVLISILEVRPFDIHVVNK